MSFNGSGTFVINTAGQPVVTGTTISSTAFNALTADLATGLSTAITKDGQTTTTAPISFAGGLIAFDATFLLKDSTDVTKIAQFQCGSITTGNTRTYTLPDATTTLLGTNSITIASGKTLTVNNSLTLAGTDGKTLTTSNSLTLAGTDGKTLTLTDSLTVNNALTLAGTNATTMTFPTTNATLARTDAAQTFTGTQTFSGTIVSPAVAKAWVHFSAAPSACTIYGTPFNVSSVTYNSAGNYTVNFTTNMSDTNYSFAGMGGVNAVTEGIPEWISQTVSAFRFSSNNGGSAQDSTHVSMIFFGN